MAIFTYIPTTDFSKAAKPRIRIAQFGDGYSQRVPDGINHIVENWSLTFKNRSLADADAILLFFEDHNGSDAFTWTPPGDSSSISVYCSEWSESYSSPITRTITAKFIRVYEGVA